MSFPRYNDYQDSGLNWLGQVPGHWSLRRLGYFFGERREKVSDRDYQPLSVTKDGIVPQLDTAAKTDDGDNRKKVCKGDFAINSRSDRKGSAGISGLDGSVSLISTVLKPKESVHGPFVHHLLRCTPFQEEFYRFGKGIVADLWSTNYASMSGITLAMPPMTEQYGIANFLDCETAKIDALIAEQQRLIELLQEKRQAVISHAVTKGLNPNAPMKNSGVEWLGEVPEHWGVKRVKQCIDPARPVTYGILKPGETDENGIPMIRAQDYSSEWKPKEGILMVSAETEAPYIRSRVRAGDVLITVVGAGTGNCAVVPDYLDGSNISRASCRISVDNRKLTSSYLLFVLSSIATKTTIELSTRGAAQPVLNNSEVENLLVPLPPQEEQNQLVQVLCAQVQRLDKQQGLAFRQVELLQERRSALISAAVTGQIDVRGLVTEEEP